MGGRTQTLDWLNAELDSKESQLAAARQELDAARLSNRDSQRLLNELNHELAESRERERKMMAVIDEVNDLRQHDAGMVPLRIRILANEFPAPINHLPSKASAEEPATAAPKFKLNDRVIVIHRPGSCFLNQRGTVQEVIGERRKYKVAFDHVFHLHKPSVETFWEHELAIVEEK